MEEHRRLQGEAVKFEAEGQRALMAGEDAAPAFARAAASYRASWAQAPPDAYGRLVGAVKAGVLAGQGAELAAFARGELSDPGTSATGWYALALAALAAGDDATAVAAARRMEAAAPSAPSGQGSGGPDPFLRAARAIEALADGDADAYAEAVTAIVRDFEARAHHLTGVALADTAYVLERLAAERGRAAGVRSDVLPDTMGS